MDVKYLSTRSDLKDLLREEVCFEKVVLKNDIDLGGEKIEPIEKIVSDCHFDGNGNEIRNFHVKVELENDSSGFIRVNNGIVENLDVSGFSLKAKSKPVGLIGRNLGKVSNCSVKRSILWGKMASGIAGFNGDGMNLEIMFGDEEDNSSIRNCSVEDCYILSRSGSGSGIASINHNLVDDCRVTGTVFDCRGEVGGVVEENYGTVNRCSVEGVEIYAGHLVGGLVATNKGDVKKSWISIDSIVGKNNVEEFTAGSLIGYNNQKLKNCHCISRYEKFGFVGEGNKGKKVSTLDENEDVEDVILLNEI